MRALVKYAKGEGNVEIRQVPKPEIKEPDEVLIKIKAAGICGTDVHVWQDKFMSWPPVILGHEFAGEIVETGSKCRKYKAGDRVVVEPQIKNCGICEFCRSGRTHLCMEKWTLGWRTDGCMTEYVTAPEMFLHRIPDGLDYTMAALAEPLAVAVYDIAEHGKININDFVVVQGSGPIGILGAYMAKRLGARYVLLTGIDASEICRFDAAKKMGADEVINVQKQNVLERVMELTEGMGADCVIETSGAPSAVSGCVEMMKKNGRLIGMGIPAASEIPFPWRDAVLKALEFYFSMSTSYTSWDKALCLLQQDKETLKNIVTWTGDIEDWEDVFKSLVEEKNIKAVFTF